ncbi:MAG: heavy-metal-associated domain-containing protein [Deferribacterales bacterium]|nr:heavy-metal-associated domain-containing protein [Deferribacterales bacterium]
MTYTINVKGMRCAHCVKSVQEGVSAISGVTSCAVSLENGTVTVETESNIPTAEVIKSTIEDLGFEVA